MTFWEHLDQLRGVLIRSIVAIILLTIIAFSFKGILFDIIILGPKNSDFITYRILCKIGKALSMNFFCLEPSTIKLININLAGQFMSHMTISIMAGFIIASPYIVWEFWRFIKPGLTENEKKNHTRSSGSHFRPIHYRRSFQLFRGRTVNGEFPRKLPGECFGCEPDRPDFIHKCSHHDVFPYGIGI